MMEDETYLGDGLYAAYNGYQIRLRAPRENGDHIVYLDIDGGILKNFMLYVKSLANRGISL